MDAAEVGGLGQLPLVGRNTFTRVNALAADSYERSSERSNEIPRRGEQAGDHTPVNSENLLVDGMEEDWWTGTD